MNGDGVKSLFFAFFSVSRPFSYQLTTAGNRMYGYDGYRVERGGDVLKNIGFLFVLMNASFSFGRGGVH